MDSITSLEWQALLRAGILVLIVLGGMFGVTVFVVKWQLGNLAKGQSLLFAKFNEGGEVHDIAIRINRIENILMHTNADDTIVTRAILGGKK